MRIMNLNILTIYSEVFDYNIPRRLVRTCIELDICSYSGNIGISLRIVILRSRRSRMACAGIS